jgi:sugar phosphate isomerase/epimerase
MDTGVDYMGRLAMSEVTTFPWAIDKDIPAYARHGFPGIELWLNKVSRNGAPYDKLPEGEIDDSEIADLVEALDKAGLRAASVVCAGGLTFSDEALRRERISHLRFTIRFAAAVGAGCVLVVPGDLEGAERSTAVARTAAALEEALPDAHHHGVDLAIEPLRPIHTNFVNTLPQALEIVTAVDDPHCGVCMDTFQVWRGADQRDDVLSEIREAAQRTQIVQVADSRVEARSREDRLIPGEGVLPLEELLAPLFATQYAGWLAVEIMSSELWAGDLDDLLSRCKAGMEKVISGAMQVAYSGERASRS